MVDLSDRVKEIRKLVDTGKYFTINRARQYGKTTTLSALIRALDNEYVVLFLDFQGIGNDSFANEANFSKAMARIVLDAYEFEHVPIPSNIVSECMIYTH